MDIRFQTLGKGSVKLDVALLLTVAGEAPCYPETFAERAAPWLAASGALADHSGKKGEVTVCYGPRTAGMPRAILAGLGEDGKISSEDVRGAVAAAMRCCKRLGLARVGIVFENLASVAAKMGKPVSRVLEETVYAALVSVYSCTEFRSAEARAKGAKDRDPDFFEPGSLVILHGGRSIPGSVRVPVRLAEAEAAGVRLARNLVNAPANIMTPERMADEAVALAKRHGFDCRILHKAEMGMLGMGAFLAVNAGAQKEARFIVIEYTPSAGKKQAPLVLVGKGLTFDSGGISLKPSANMHHMKGDMAGGAAVLGTFEVIGNFPERFPWPVVGLIPCTENMPDGGAVRPGDIVTTMSGKTVEILNTDAEGRLALADALTYAQKHWKPLAIVDIATLTGACAVALGHDAAGVFTEDAVLRDVLLKLGEQGGETFWPMPLWQRMREGLKSAVADIANVGPREGGAISAALFLQTFVDSKIPWAHIDMAGADMVETDTPLCPKGATGFGVRTLAALAGCVSGKMFK